MALRTVVRRACLSPSAPRTKSIQRWAHAAYESGGTPGIELELTVRIADESEARELNLVYRGQDYVPNVLSFPMNARGSPRTGLLGDIVICPAVAAREAAEQNKSVDAHWSHLVIHGVLHCCGFEHDSDAGAECMESLETRIMAEFGYPDPYTLHDEQ
ncbi:MAG: Endoribonuclease YbeY [Gammaproteobacteria bacterium]|nr:Endoribonuclease YbeY [Gammaproteobacteria bacterium]